MEHELMTVKEVAAFLRCHIMTVHRMLREGKIPGAARLGQYGAWRISRKALVEWVNGNSNKSG